MVTYFMYYTFVTKSGIVGDGNVDVTLEGPISSIERIRSIEASLKDADDYKSLVIVNYQRFETS